MLRHLIVFDIDSTLLRVEDAGGVFSRVHVALTGAGLEHPLDISAQPELRILQQLLERCGLDGDHELLRLQRLYHRELQEELRVRPPRVLTGARELLRRLVLEHAALTFATGNSRIAAKLKLRTSGLHETLSALGIPFQGGFGDRSSTKRAVVRKALEHWMNRDSGEWLAAIVGDSALDMLAGRELGMRCIGVCTGQSSREALLAAGADYVLESLADTDAAAAAILNFEGSAMSESQPVASDGKERIASATPGRG